MTGRKHLMTFEAQLQVRSDDVERLRAALDKRRNPTMQLSEADDDDTTADYVEYFIGYGPVRGANLTDVTRFLDNHKIGYVLDPTTTYTTYVCGCPSSSRGCTDGAAVDPAKGDGEASSEVSSTEASQPEWHPGMDW